MKTLEDVFRDYISIRVDISESTIEQYRICLRQLNRWAGRPLTVKELDAELILSFMRHRKSLGKSPRTINNLRQILLTLWRHAFRKHFTTIIPPDFRDLPKMKTVKTIPEAWSLQELDKILHSCDNTRPLPYWDYRHWRALVLTLYDTAHRLEAVLSARVEDIHDGFLTVRKTKQNREIAHKLHSDTLIAIDRLPEHESGLLFPWPYKRRQIWREFGRILKAADLPGGYRNKFHKIRRTSATHLCAVAGVSITEAHLGHLTPGLALKSYIDPRYQPKVNGSDVMPRPGETEVTP